MKVNTKTRYGLRVMIEVAANDQNGGVLQKDVSTRQNISYKYLDQIIAGLKSSGLIGTVAGRKSGYKLMKPSSSITAYDVYRTFNHELEIVDGVASNDVCDEDQTCVTRGMWCEINDMIKIKLQSVTLSSLVEKYNNTKTDAFTYHI